MMLCFYFFYFFDAQNFFLENLSCGYSCKPQLNQFSGSLDRQFKSITIESLMTKSRFGMGDESDETLCQWELIN